MRYLLEPLTWKVGTLVIAAAATAGAMAEQHIVATAATAGAMPERQTHQPTQTAAFNAAMSKIVADVTAQCKKNELQSFYKKTPCLAGDISPDQLVDTSKASADEKAAIQKVRNEVADTNKRLAQALRQYGGQKGNSKALVAEKVGQRQQQAMTDLYLEKISWGDYNARRKDISKLARDEMSAAEASK